MRNILLENRYCKEVGYYFKEMIPIDYQDENYKDYATKFLYGYVNEDIRYNFLVPNIRTSFTTFYIHTYRKMDYKVDDMIMIDNKYYNIESVSKSFDGKGKYLVPHYFITLK